MFQYEYEKRPTERSDSRTRMSYDFYARRPLPPRPGCDNAPANTAVPLKVWIIAGASCFAVCAVLVLATVVITRWGTAESYTPREIYAEVASPIYAIPYPQNQQNLPTEASEEMSNEIQYPVLEKLSIFKNLVSNRNKKEETNLAHKPQLHPIHDTSLQHPERKIEKKDQAKLPDNKIPEFNNIPEFKPTLPDIFLNQNIDLDGYLTEPKPDPYEDYYDDENLYDDYMQSNSMTSYLIEKVQELHDWITSDNDFEVNNKRESKNEFGQVLKALNESIVDGNVTIIMGKLREMYFGDNYTIDNSSKKIILTNSTSLLSFGILTLDIMLLYNIQLMAWENQEGTRNKMLKDPDVFAFNALFMDPNKIESKRNEILNHETISILGKRQNRQEEVPFDFGKNIIEAVLEVGMSTARAAIHLGRAYKNTKLVLSQLTNRESLNANIQNQISRNIDANTHALNHLQTSFKNDNSSVANVSSEIHTDLDCVWMLYCKNLGATAKLNAPYGTMARINGLALRMLAGEISTGRALDAVLYEMLVGWTDLRCDDMFPKCSKVDAASIVLDSILQPLRKGQVTNKL